MRAIVTFGYVGLIPRAPGTFGTLAALPVGYALHVLGGFPLLVIATLAVFVLGYWATVRAIADDPTADPGWIVVDEVVGLWIALFPLSFGLWHAGAAPMLFPWPGWVGAFVMFRLFDILKPWPVSRVDAMHGAAGVMLDDVAAGVMAALVVALAAFIAHGMMGA
ncbi:phosphatidylglycerophosphatase A [Halovulum dunhuangense]|uniref:Phosphatidylglycerophosphatase A n=1 Tax=Halovulum dunhuangense TaxID=1505036 RepID=A0A849L378_9RHOB|nr:phosphatidylglycerophosphatase A [Halovulum dunhuangense]